MFDKLSFLVMVVVGGGGGGGGGQRETVTDEQKLDGIIEVDQIVNVPFLKNT